MTSRMHHIAAEVDRFLNRIAPPRAIQDNPQAVEDTRASIVRAVARSLPNDGYTDLLCDLLDEVEAKAKGFFWPTVGEINSAAKTVLSGKVAASNWRPKMESTVVSKIAGGDPVPEDWLFGRRSAQLLRAGVEKDRLDAYRQAAFQSRHDVHGEDVANAWAADVKANHAADLEAEGEERRAYAAGEIVSHIANARKVAPTVVWDD